MPFPDLFHDIEARTTLQPISSIAVARPTAIPRAILPAIPETMLFLTPPTMVMVPDVIITATAPTRLQPDIVTTGQITIDLTATRLSPAFPITVTITSIPAGFVTHGTRTLPVTVRLIQDIAVPMSPMEGVTVSLRAVMLLTGAAMSLTGAPTMVRPGRTLPAIMEIFTGPTALASGLIALPCMAALSFKLAITWATVAAVTIASGKRIPQSEQPDRVL